MNLSKIENKYKGYRLEVFNKKFEFYKYVWKNENKPKKGEEKRHIVTYNFLFPNGGLNLYTVWNQKKGDYWEKDGKKHFLKFANKRIVIGKFVIMWSFKTSEKEKESKEYNLLEEK